MIQFNGYGIILIMIDYFGSLFLLSKLSPYLFKTEKSQYIALLSFHILITCVNYFVVKCLNRKVVKHKVYGIRLEKAVLIVGLLFLPLIFMMGKDVIF